MAYGNSEVNNMLKYNHLSDTFNSSNINVYLNNFYMPDVIGLTYDLVYDKSPIYSYNSEFFSNVAVGNSIVQGSLVVLFTETAYFEIIRQQLMNKAVNTYRQFVPGTIVTDSGVNQETYDFSNDQTSIYGTPLLTTNTRVVETTTNELFNISIYRRSNIPVLPTKNLEDSSRIPLVSNRSIYNMTNQGSDKPFENIATALENVIWDNGVIYEGNISSDKDKGFAVWDPLYTRVRNDMEMDYDFIMSSDKYIRTIANARTNPFTLYILYGDVSNPAAESTMESIDDIHFRSRRIAVNNDGLPVAAMYEFFGRSLNANAAHKLILRESSTQY